MALARLIAAPALLWLLDEPTIALDDAAQTLLHGVMKTHLAAGGLIIAATHVQKLNCGVTVPLTIRVLCTTLTMPINAPLSTLIIFSMR